MQRTASFKNILLLIVVSKKEIKRLCTELTLVSTALPRLLLSETATSTKTLLSQSVILITRYKSGAILLSTHIWQNFPKKCHFHIISEVQWWTKKFHPFLDSTYQKWMIFAKIGDGPCYYHWNEDCAGVWGLLLNRIIFS